MGTGEVKHFIVQFSPGTNHLMFPLPTTNYMIISPIAGLGTHKKASLSAFGEQYKCTICMCQGAYTGSIIKRKANGGSWKGYLETRRNFSNNVCGCLALGRTDVALWLRAWPINQAALGLNRSSATNPLREPWSLHLDPNVQYEGKKIIPSSALVRITIHECMWCVLNTAKCYTNWKHCSLLSLPPCICTMLATLVYSSASGKMYCSAKTLFGLYMNKMWIVTNPHPLFPSCQSLAGFAGSQEQATTDDVIGHHPAFQPLSKWHKTSRR